MAKILEDREGNKSSKRVIGSIFVAFGLIGKIIIFVMGCLSDVLMVNFINLDGSTNNLIYAGTALLGVSVLEFLPKKRK